METYRKQPPAPKADTLVGRIETSMKQCCDQAAILKDLQEIMVGIGEILIRLEAIEKAVEKKDGL